MVTGKRPFIHPTVDHSLFFILIPIMSKEICSISAS